MDDGKCDGYFYRKLPSDVGSGFVKRVVDYNTPLVCTISEARTSVGLAPHFHKTIITTDLGQEGEWYLDLLDTTTPDNTGTVIVTDLGYRLKRVWKDYVHVDWFGAKPDGVTDSSSAITLAMGALPDFGGTLQFGEGLYLVESTLVVPLYGVRNVPITFRGINQTSFSQSIEGSNRGVTKIVFTGGGILFDCVGGDDSSVESYCSFIDLSMVRILDDENYKTGNAIKCWKFRGTLRNVLISGFDTGVLITNWLYYSHIENCHILNCNRGMDLNLVNGTSIDKCRFNNNDIGLYYNNSGRSCSIYSTWFEGNRIGIRTDGTRQVNLYDVYFEANTETSIWLEHVNSDPGSSEKAVLNMFGGSLSINSPATSGIKASFTGAGVRINISGTVFANRSPEAITVIESRGGTSQNRPQIIVSGTAWYAVDPGLIEIPWASGAGLDVTEVQNTNVIINGRTITASVNNMPPTTSPRYGSICLKGSSVTRSAGWVYTSSDEWVPFGQIGVDINAVKSGPTANRPTVTTVGYEYFDTTLGKAINWSGSNWVDATGATV